MPNYCKTIIAGHTCKDVELRFMPSGKAVGNFTIAFNREWKTETGEKHSESTFVDCTVFGKQAEVLSQYTKKGAPILLEGRLKQENWEDKNTHVKRSKLVLVVEGFTFLGKRDDGDAPPRTAAPEPAAAPAPEAPSNPPVEEDDVPF